MQLLSPSQVYALGAGAPRAAPLSFTAIDFSLPFIHEEATQLYYTPLYARLEPAQRLRYNQLFALKVNEQFLAFEQDFTNRVVPRIAGQPAVAADPILVECLERMVREEEDHHRMFHELNVLCLPEIYDARERYFTRLGPLEARVFALVTRFARRLPFLLFFILAIEEYSIALSRAVMLRRQTLSLGPLEPNFVRAHAEHVKDEVRHVHLDVHLIEACREACSPRARLLNAALFKAFLKDLVIPKRAGLAVLRRWLAETPELGSRGEEFIRAVRALEHDTAFQCSLFNREALPLTFSLFDAQPEMWGVEAVLPGYRRRG
jgi:hypothetical protein